MDKDKKDKQIPFKIDRDDYKISESQNPTTGGYLRSLPPLTDEYDLWMRARGEGDDPIINSADSITIQPGDHFYSAKRAITPGQE